MICFRMPEVLAAKLDAYAAKYDIPRSTLVRHAIVALVDQLDQTQPLMVLPPGFKVKVNVTPLIRKVESEIPSTNSPIWNEESESENYGKDRPE